MKTIFNDPINWAQKAVGTQVSYRLIQFLTLFMAVLLIVHFFYHPEYQTTMDHAPMFSAYIIWLVFYPLAFLRATRALVLDRTKHKESADK